MTKIIFWDYDGTLVDTEILYKKSLVEFFTNNKILLKNISNEYFFKNIAGKHPENFIEKLKNDKIIKDITIDNNKIRTAYKKFFENLKENEIKIIDGMDFIIEELSKEKDTIMCITSSSLPQDFAIKQKNVNNKILNKIFNTDKNVYLCGGIENCKFKPEPDVYFYTFNDIKNKYNLTFNENDILYIIEDSIAGCLAGNAFKNNLKEKIKVKIININFNNTNELDKIKADYIVNSSEKLFEIIK